MNFYNRVPLLACPAVLTALAGVAILFTGCDHQHGAPQSSVGTPTSASTAPKPVHLDLMLNWYPEAEHGGYYAALVHGYYREAGLDVTIHKGGPDAPVVPQVARGAVQCGVANADNIILARAQSAPVVALFAPLENSPRCIMVHAESGIKTFDDLHDITLAMTAGAPFAQYLRKHVKLENVKIVPYGASVAPFLHDPKYAQQAYMFSEPFVARSQGAEVRLLMVSELGFNPYTSLLFTSEKQLAGQPDVMRRLVEASARGWQKYLAEPDETNKHIHSLNPEMSEDILRFGAEQLRTLQGKQQAVTMTLDRWQQLTSQLEEIDQIKPGMVKVRDAFVAKTSQEAQPPAN